jgi:2-desacetyl-2-hydroxyethyl bacteriochlorophyllide A dehydrogenase
MPDNLTGPMTVPCIMCTGKNTMELKERKLEQLAPGQVRLRTEYSMVSTGTELHRIMDTHTVSRGFPIMTGYLAIGTVVGLGEGVKKAKLGDRVLFRFAHYSMVDAPEGQLTAVPAGLASTDAICAPLMGISLRAIRAARVVLGDSVAIFGQGVIGLFATHLAKLSGACPVIAVDLVAARRQVARKMGADVVIDPAAEDVAKRIAELTSGKGVNAAIDASATTKVMPMLPALVRDEGRVIVLGGVHGKVEMDLYTHFQKNNLTMVGCGSPFHSDYPYDEDGNIAALMNMMQAGMVKPAPAISHCVDYRQGPEVFRMLIEEKDKAIGVQFDWR